MKQSKIWVYATQHLVANKLSNQVIILCFLLISVSLQATAQKQDFVDATVTYRFSHVLDTADLNTVFEENMTLYIGKNSSMYLSSDKIYNDSLQSSQRKSRPNVNVVRPTNGGSPTSYYHFLSENQWYQVERMFMNNYVFPLDNPQFNWKLTNDTLTISGMKCQKAVGHWKGRDYSAWFCPKLPFSSGPWKFGGLPGLILTVSDSKEQIKFEVVDLKINKNKTKTIQLPNDRLTRVTQKEYNRLRHLFETNPRAYLLSIVGAKNMNSIVISPSFAAKPLPKNPIELSDK